VQESNQFYYGFNYLIIMGEIDNIRKHQHSFKERFPSKSDTFNDKHSASEHLKAITELSVFEEGVVIRELDGYYVCYRLKSISDGNS